MSTGERICFAFSIHKAGSTLFYNLLLRAMQRAQVLGLANAYRYLSIPDALFNAGVPEKVLEDPDFSMKHNQGLDEGGTLYGGFRFVPSFATDAFLGGKRVMVLVRDPRDVLTSLYFSVQRSHRIPAGEAGVILERQRAWALSESIDDYVLHHARHRHWRARFARLNQIKGLGRSWRYEDVVFAKGPWLDAILDYLQVDLPRCDRDEIVLAEDLRPEREDPDSHVRQVAPGDHRRKLRPETIEELSRLFADTLAVWGYEGAGT